MAPMSKQVLLIDGDVDCYRAAYAGQRETDWGNGKRTTDLDEGVVADYLKARIDLYRRRFKTDEMIWCLSDTERNWRKELCPTYKANRKNTMRPELLGWAREYVKNEFAFPVEVWPGLEADDVLGLLSAEIPKAVVISIDKDMLTLPGKIWNPGHGGPVEKPSISRAVRRHLEQTLVGDQVDGYPGCPGVGWKKAERIVGNIFADFPRRILSDERQMYVEAWPGIESEFENRSSNKEFALLQARLAYILRHPHEYDIDKGKVKLWHPARD